MAKKKTTLDLHLDIIDLGFKIDLQSEKFITKDEFNQKHNLVMVTLEKVLKEVLAMRQEQVISSQSHEDTTNEVKGLKKRVEKLEQNPSTPQL